MKMAVKFDSMVLMVSDLRRSVEFYRDKLGMPVRYNSEGFVTLDADAVPFQLEALSEAARTLGAEAVLADREAGHRLALTVRVEDVDAAYRDLREKGVKFIKAPTDMPWGHRNADFVDPDGNIWVLYKPLERQRR
jgi:catechol 2,3-dioxygenase-like lactoylglutathione lyase family enzyme